MDVAARIDVREHDSLVMRRVADVIFEPADELEFWTDVDDQPGVIRNDAVPFDLPRRRNRRNEKEQQRQNKSGHDATLRNGDATTRCRNIKYFRVFVRVR